MQFFSEDYLAHYGVKNMKWGKRKAKTTTSSDASSQTLEQVIQNQIDEKQRKKKYEKSYKKTVKTMDKLRKKLKKSGKSFNISNPRKKQLSSKKAKPVYVRKRGNSHPIAGSGYKEGKE